MQPVMLPSVATPVAGAREESTGRASAPLVGGVVGLTVAGATAYRRMPTTSFGPVQKLWVPALAGALAFGAATGIAAGINGAGDHAGIGADQLDAALGMAGLGAWILLGRGNAAQRSNAVSFLRTFGGVTGMVAATDAAIRHGGDAIEGATGLDGGTADLAGAGLLAGIGATAGLLATRRMAAANATYTGERAFGYAIGERIAERPTITPLATVSLGDASAVPQDTIGKLGRQFLEGAIPASEIEAALGRPAKDPARVFVDLDSASDAAGRLDLLRSEVRRLGIIGGDNHRSTIVMVSPAGAVTDLVATDTRELLAGGDIAHLAVAFSDRPALQSINRIRAGVRQFHDAVDVVREEIARLPEAQRPRLEVYGESIGGIVGEQAMLKEGIAGLDARGIDRAIYVGSPSAGRAKRALLAAEGGGDAPRVIRYASLDDANARYGTDAIANARVQFLEHSEDAITSLRPRRIWQATQVPEGSVVRNQADHVPFASFSHMVGDAINFKQPPGRLGARGHNYGADMPGVLRQLHPEVTDEQMFGVVDVVRRKAADRARLVDVPTLPEAFSFGDPVPWTGGAR